MKKILEKNRVVVDIKDQEELLNTADLIIDMLKDKETVKKISEYNEEVEGFILQFGNRVQDEFMEWTLEDIEKELEFEFYEEDINESYLAYLFALGETDGGKEKILEILDTILSDEELSDMYENEFIYIHETPFYVLSSLYPEYSYYLGTIVNEMPLAVKDHWYLELGRETIQKMDKGINSLKLFSHLFASHCIIELFEEEYEELGEELAGAIIEDEMNYKLFMENFSARIFDNHLKSNESDLKTYVETFIEERNEHVKQLIEDELEVDNTKELMNRIEVHEILEKIQWVKAARKNMERNNLKMTTPEKLGI